MISRKIGDINSERFLSRVSVDLESGCWNYNGASDRNGYGRCYFWKNGKTVSYLAHRVSGTLFGIIIDLSKVLDHTCMNRKCVNPEHLREVSFKTNLLENSNGVSAINSKKTHCPSGHSLSGENLGVNKAGSRFCRTCKRITIKRAKQKENKCLME